MRDRGRLYTTPPPKVGPILLLNGLRLFAISILGNSNWPEIDSDGTHLVLA